MHTISATEIKQNSMRLQEALCHDILITKRDKPFVVVMDYEKYTKLKDLENEWPYWQESALIKEAKRIKNSSLCEYNELNDSISDKLENVN